MVVKALLQDGCLCLFARWHGWTAVHDEAVSAGSCWQHERHDGI